jgi:acyl transferase domain-containing protein/acyl carrier protein
MADPKRAFNGSEIAIVGMACRFPGASDLEQFWRNLVGGVESLSLLTDDDLARAGVPPELIASAGYVRRAPVVEGIEMFDAAFFGYTPLEARIMDPQQRLFLECAWEVFEQAGYDPETYPAPVGVFTGAKTNTYLFSLFSNRELFRSLDKFQIALGNDLACMATRVSYKLNLRGPSYALHTACSTSLVAVHLACQSLLLDECRMAVAGGAAINVPQCNGYPYQKGGMLSPDGSCRTFDEQAAGSNFGNGVGAVLLKRLEDALADGDHIHALILGSATNNDGAQKASYTAPGVEGQTRVLLEAMACAGMGAEDITYVEAHGTATDLGDSIEMLALTDAFRATTDRKGYCAIGSVKTNLGHLETAAGMAGLLKTALALEVRQLPPSLHFERPNPKIDFANSPFYVNTRLAEWPSDGRPRRAGLSSFGIGSTNCHVILEEPPPPVATTAAARALQLLVISARTPEALDAMGERLARHLEEHPEVDLADVAWTLHAGRKGFHSRRAVVAADAAGAAALLRGEDGPRRHSGDSGTAERPVVFVFPGLGDHYVEMGLGIYQTEPVFRETLDRSAELLRPELGCDLRELIYPRGTDAPEAVDAAAETDLRRLLGRGTAADDEASRRLHETRYAQPATFAVEYALARLWMSWGVTPRAMLGYSVGEYVAACLAGVLSLEDSLRLVARRARLIQELPGGAMTAVPLAEDEIAPLLARHGLSLAALNGPAVSVASGPETAVAALERELAGSGVVCRRLPATHAFHSTMMAAAAAPLTELARLVGRRAPQIPYLSNVTGSWITAAEAADPAYWARHMCGPVRFADGVAALLRSGERIFVEVGPGQGLSSFVRLHPDCDKESGRRVVASLRPSHGGRSGPEVLLAALGQVWIHGAPVDWKAFHAGERRRRVPLPTYPFERSRHWIDPVLPEAPRAGVARNPQVREWFWRRAWRREDAPPATAVEKEACWLILADAAGIGTRLAGDLARRGANVVLARPGDARGRAEDGAYLLRTGEADDWGALFEDLVRRRKALRRVVHLATLGPAQGFEPAQELGFHSLVALVQALGRQGFGGPLRLDVITDGVQSVTGAERLAPEKSTLLGACLVIPQEHPNLACRVVDIEAGDDAGALARTLLAEVLGDGRDPVVALRGGERRVQVFEKNPLEPTDRPVFRNQGAYLIVGGLGGIGLILARHLARTARAPLVLTRRSPFPERAEWDAWLAGQGEADPRTAQVIRTVRELEDLGAEVMVASADVADEAAMGALVAAARERFGALHGVIHAAGVLGPEAFQPLIRSGREDAALHFQPKARGVLVLERVLRGVELDFCLLFSSISTVLGGFGNVVYAAANQFMDSFAEQRNRDPGPAWISVAWDSWTHDRVGGDKGGVGTTLSELAATPAEGCDALERVLASGLRRLVQSTGDLGARLDQWVRRPEPPAAASSRRELGPGPAGDELERRIAAIWRRHLGVEVGPEENFFDLGGNSLLGMQVIADVNRDLGVEVTPIALFESPTVRALARHLGPRPPVEAPRRARRRRSDGESEIAVISMAGRFPGARNVEELWENLRAGRETISFFTDEELLAAGNDPELLKEASFVPARPILEDVEMFDAAFFGYSPRDAELMDPQHRVFLECAWEAFELAGYDTERYDGLVGVYAGASISSYMYNIYSNPDLVESVGTFPILIGNEKDAVTTRVSYKLNLRGPSLAVQTFCSTSLVATHLARQALLDGECDMALAGGVSIILPQVSGYLYQEGGIGSRDGHIRAFDAGASGIVFGNGAGAVLLKRLPDALADGDRILAVIKGSAVNNDGSVKAGYTATSVDGQAEVVSAVLETSGIDPETIGYMEAHGTGTPLGDPIEMAALAKAFRVSTDRRRFCPIGSVKTNLGHLDRAAGISGLIKTVLALEHREIPPSLHFEMPNPNIDFEDTPFFVNTELRPWVADGRPRRAGVNSLGLGGTNAHALLEEAPEIEPSSPSRPWELLLLSAATATALESATDRLAAWFRGHPAGSFSDVAHTLQVGRKEMAWRRVAVASGLEEAAAALASRDPRRVLSAVFDPRPRQVVFLFPGLGGQYTGMARGLYETEAVFRDEVDRCAALLPSLLGVDIREVIWPGAPAEERPAGEGFDLRRMLRGTGGEDEPARRLSQTWLAQPALFVVEVALARLWMAWGIRPAAVLGYSVGEYAAAHIAGVLSLEDALTLVAQRARLIDELPAGAMLAVALAEESLLPRLGPELSLAALNGPEQSVVAGPCGAVLALEEDLAAAGIVCRRLQTTHAFHSRMMVPLFAPVVEMARAARPAPPQIPILSNVTGAWLTPEEAVDPEHWARHMCGPVRFAAAVRELLSDAGGRVFLELGPGQTLGSLLLQQAAAGTEPLVVPSLRHSYETHADPAYLLQGLGRLWLAGVAPDWRSFRAGERRLRVPLPTYPFERQRFWIEARESGYANSRRLHPKQRDAASWFWVPTWKRSAAPRETVAGGRWLVLSDGGLGADLVAALRAAGGEVIAVEPGSAFAALGGGAYRIDPGADADLARLLAEIGGAPERIVHTWSLGAPPGEGAEALAWTQELGFGSLLALARVLTAEPPAGRIALWVVTAGLQEVSGEEERHPEGAIVLGACEVLPREVPGLSCRVVDLPAKALGDRWVRALLAELGCASDERLVAWRGPHRWVPEVEPATRLLAVGRPRPLREGGLYLVAGGLDGPGAVFASVLASEPAVRLLVLAAPGSAPEPWLRELGEHGTEVLAAGVDLTQADRVAEAVAEAERQLGPLRGVIFAASPGETASRLADGNGLLQAQARALRNLDGLLRGRELDFALLVASAAPGRSAVAAAAGFLFDAFAETGGAHEPGRWTSIAWDPGEEERGEAAAAVMRRLLGAALGPRLIVAPRLAADRWNRIEEPAAERPRGPSGATGGAYARPDLRIDYVAPRTELETTIAAVWGDLLGVARVGVNDGFLALGGDSLLAARLAARLREVLGVELPVRLFFERSTVAELAAAVEELKQADLEAAMKEVRNKVAALSEDELETEILRMQALLDGAGVANG